MNLTDTHIHLYADELSSDRTALIEEALAGGINAFFLPNIDSSSISPMADVCKAYPDHCFPMMGLHPCSVNESHEQEWKIIEREFGNGSYYAVGETGLDFYWDKTHIAEQEKLFIRQLHIAQELNLPVVIHSRNSIDRIIEIIRQHDYLGTKGIFHCFSGNADQARQIIELGMFLGIGGVVTFKNSGLDKVLSDIPVHHLVLETDAPYLAPVPHRGKRNVPAYLIYVAEKLAQIKNLTLEEVGEITTHNARQIFGYNA